MAAKKPAYKVLKGINYPPDGRRAEPGAVVDDLPDFSIRGLIGVEAIELIDDGEKKQDEKDGEGDKK